MRGRVFARPRWARVWWLLCLLSAALPASLARAQSGAAGAMTGTVVDAAGAPIAGAVVRARDAAGRELTAATDAHGAFTVSALRPGHYAVRAEHGGLAGEIDGGADVAAGRTVTVSLTLVPRLFFDVTVSAASRTEEEARDTPQAVSVATSEAIDRQAARTPNEMLSQEPGVWSVQVSAQGSPIVRGQIGNKVLYLWDGIPLNNGALFSGPNGFFNEFPVGSVDEIEVIRGPGAVQFGSDAIGGVININDRKAPGFSKTVQFGGDVDTRYGTVDGEHTSTGNVWLAAGRVSLDVGLTGQDIGSYSIPSGAVMASSGMKAVGGNLDATFKINDQQELHAAWIHDRRYDIESYVQSKLNASGIPRIFGPYEQRDIGRADYLVNRPHGALSQIKFYGYEEVYGGERDTLVESTTQFNKTDQVTNQHVYGGGGQGTASAGGFRLVFGGDARTENLQSDKTLLTTTKATGGSVTSVPNGNVPNGTYAVADAFALLQRRVSSRLVWTAGGRVETTKLHSEPRPQDALTPFTIQDLMLTTRWNAATWSTGAVLAIAHGWSLAGNVATSFRAPTFSDTLSTGVPVFASGVATVPSPGVKPEQGITYELGPRYASRRVNFSLTAYSNQLTNLLTSVADGTITIPGVGVVTALHNVNTATAYVRGVEAVFAARVGAALTIKANATVTRGEDTTLSVPLRFIPPANGTVTALWSGPVSRWWLEGSATFADRLRRHAPADELDAGFSTDPGYGSPSATNPALPGFQIPGFTVVNARAGMTVWQDGSGGRRRVELTLDVNNLFNETYREAYAQQEFAAPGRGALLSARVRF